MILGGNTFFIVEKRKIGGEMELRKISGLRIRGIIGRSCEEWGKRGDGIPPVIRGVNE